MYIMNYDTFKSCAQQAGLGIKDFAAYVGMNHRSISNYSKKGAVPDHLAIIALLLMELRRHDIEIAGLLTKMNWSERQLRLPQKGEFRGRSAQSNNQGNE